MLRAGLRLRVLGAPVIHKRNLAISALVDLTVPGTPWGDGVGELEGHRSLRSGRLSRKTRNFELFNSSIVRKCRAVVTHRYWHRLRTPLLPHAVSNGPRHIRGPLILNPIEDPWETLTWFWAQPRPRNLIRGFFRLTSPYALYVGAMRNTWVTRRVWGPAPQPRFAFVRFGEAEYCAYPIQTGTVRTWIQGRHRKGRPLRVLWALVQRAWHPIKRLWLPLWGWLGYPLTKAVSRFAPPGWFDPRPHWAPLPPSQLPLLGLRQKLFWG